MHEQSNNRILQLTNNSQCICCCAIIISSFILFCIVSVVTRGDTIGQLFFNKANDTFNDYFSSIYAVRARHPYENGVQYPPFCEMIFYCFSRFVPSAIWTKNIRLFQGAMMSYLLFIFIAIIIIAFLIEKFTKFSVTEKRILIIAIILSAPFLYAIERGNIVLYAVAFLLAFVLLYNSSNRVLRELSLICLAICAAIKIYPAIIGLIILIDNRYADAIRCIIYGLAFLLIPFIFFGGLIELPVLFDRVLNNIDILAGQGYGMKINISNTINYLWYQLSGQKETEVSTIITLAICSMLIIGAFMQKTKWKRMTMLVCAMVGFPAYSFYYMGSFFIVPWIMMIEDEKMVGKTTISYSIILAPFPYIIVDATKETTATVDQIMVSILLLVLSVLLIADTVSSMCKNKNAKKHAIAL